ncbi:MAG: hypothetical protein RR370_03220 [Synergistaceae bacterium]
MENERVAAKGYELIRCICEHSLPDDCPYAKEETFEIKIGFAGHQLGVVVGYIKDGKPSSYFKSDVNGETNIFQGMIDNGFTESKLRCTRMKDESDFSEKEYHYIIYKLADHSSMKPTAKRNVDFSMNTAHEVTYEVLLVNNDWEGVCRYITFSYSTVGTFSTPFFSEIEDLEQKFEEMYDDCTDGVVADDDYKVFKMYDEFGEEIDTEIDGAHSLMRMIASVRLLEVKTKIIENY